MAIAAMGTIVWILVKGFFSSIGVGVLTAMFSLKGDKIDNHRFACLLFCIQFGLAVSAFTLKYIGAQYLDKVGAPFLPLLLGEALVSFGLGYWLGGAIVRRIINSRKSISEVV